MYQELSLILPEIVIAVMACLILVFDLFLKKESKFITYFLTQITLLVSAFFLIGLFSGVEKSIFYGSFIFDKTSVILKLFILLLGNVVFLYTIKYIKVTNLYKGEYFVLVLFSLLGMMVLVSSGNFLILYLGLELLALPIYALIGMSSSFYKNSSEASIKYFIMGAVSSGLLLFGISLIYGATGSIEFSVISSVVSSQKFLNLTLQYGIVFVIVGMAFKFGAVPFHMWVPDVYKGSPLPITLFIGTLPKIAAFGMSYRLLSNAFYQMSNDWEFLLIFMAIFSLLIGNIIAIAQFNIKRMLAYSAIAHVGFIFLALIYGPVDGYVSSMFYTVVYVITSLGVFGIILSFSSSYIESDEIFNFKGFYIEKPWLSLMMMFLLFSMAGVPPTIGFYAKFIVLKGIVDLGYIDIACFAVVLSVIGAFYYLRLIKIMFFDKIENFNYLNNFKMSNLGIVFISLNGLFVLFFGIYPLPIFNVCIKALI